MNLKIFWRMRDKNLFSAKDEPAAVAVVVRREAPSSGKPGDKAVINNKGEVKGWIGGGCTKGIVIKEALEAIKDQNPRLVRIQPSNEEKDQAGVKNYRMTCISGGMVEIYIEPLLQTKRLHIFGRSHIAKALTAIAHAAGYEIHVISDLVEKEMFPEAKEVIHLKDFKPEERMENDFVVVCTQGEDDEKSLKAAIELHPKYLSFVSSKRKSQSMFTGLQMDGFTKEQLSSIKTPAGLDIKAKTPEEVAISILAQIIQEYRSTPIQISTHDVPEAELLEEQDLYINPVCKIPVQKSTAKHILEYEGEKVYFCCDGCKESFEKEPAAYMK